MQVQVQVQDAGLGSGLDADAGSGLGSGSDAGLGADSASDAGAGSDTVFDEGASSFLSRYLLNSLVWEVLAVCPTTPVAVIRK